MTDVRPSGGRSAALALAALLAACQPLPHPFADDRPPAALLKIPNVAGVSIAPLVGGPRAVAEKLGGAVARALLKRDIPASSKTANLDSFQLYGRIAEDRPHQGQATMVAMWRLYDARGRTLGERAVKVAAKTSEWASGSEQPIERLASLSAESVAALLQDEAPAHTAQAAHATHAAPPAHATVAHAAAAPADDKRIRVAVERVDGAPGDGATSLATAITAMLKRHDLAIVDGGRDAKADLYVKGEVSVSPVKPGKQHIKIVWHVRRADGAEIGTVGQENNVPRGLLDGSWGDVAYSIAIAASDGLMQLVRRGTPAPQS